MQTAVTTWQISTVANRERHLDTFTAEGLLAPAVLRAPGLGASGHHIGRKRSSLLKALQSWASQTAPGPELAAQLRGCGIGCVSQRGHMTTSQRGKTTTRKEARTREWLGIGGVKRSTVDKQPGIASKVARTYLGSS